MQIITSYKITSQNYLYASFKHDFLLKGCFEYYYYILMEKIIIFFPFSIKIDVFGKVTGKKIMWKTRVVRGYKRSVSEQFQER